MDGRLAGAALVAVLQFGLEPFFFPGIGVAGEMAGVSCPLQAAEHYYLITEQIEGISNTWPVIEDPTSFGYYREEAGGLMIGLFEPEAAPWKVEGVPEDHHLHPMAQLGRHHRGRPDRYAFG